MKRTFILFLTIGAIQLSAQTPVDQARQVELSAVLAERLNGVVAQVRLNGTPNVVISGGQVVKGRPFSATEENRTLQVLGNGARIENKTTSKLFRDADGRTRTENAEGTITIVDPVAGLRATLNPKTKTATTPLLTIVGPGVLRTERISNTGSELKENLGVQSVNGISARGERVTMTIPKGDIGNDRELKVITERWTSEDLQMLIKSVNSDPRYGDTTYELTGISLAAPDAALFQIPADYTVVNLKGGRGAAPVPQLAPVPGARGGGRGSKQ